MSKVMRISIFGILTLCSIMMMVLVIIYTKGNINSKMLDNITSKVLYDDTGSKGLSSRLSDKDKLDIITNLNNATINNGLFPFRCDERVYPCKVYLREYKDKRKNKDISMKYYVSAGRLIGSVETVYNSDGYKDSTTRIEYE